MVNNGTTPVTATIEVTPSFEGCEGPSETFTITVNPLPQVDSIADQVVCSGDTIQDIIFTTQNTNGVTTYAWTNDTPSIGLTTPGSGDISSFVAINTGTSPVVATIEVTPTFTNDGVSCEGPSETFTITVNPTPQLDPISNQVVLTGQSTTQVIFSSTVDNLTYSWTNDTTSIGLAASGTGDISSFVAVNTGTSPVIATIEVIPIPSDNTIECDPIPETFTITVNPSVSMFDPADEIICNGDQLSVDFDSPNTGGSITYSWTNDTTSIGLAASGTGDISSFIAINEGTSPVVATIEVTPLFANDGVPCEGPSETFTITVNPGAQVDPIQPQELCNGDQLIVDFTTQNTSSNTCLLYTSPSPRDRQKSRMPSSA